MELSWSHLRRLDNEVGDSFYILDPDAFEANYRELQREFRAIYPHTTIAYSYKTNYTPRLCESALSLGGYAEVVSRLEYELALRIGVPPGRIIFNGPYKSADDLENALLRGSICNLDDFYEIDVLERVAQSAPDSDLTVALRCNLGEFNGLVSRFGFDAAGTALGEAVRRVRRLKNCRLSGLHFHSSAGSRGVDSYEERARRILKLCVEHFGTGGPDFVNVGGGYMSKMPEELRRQFTEPVPSFADYAKAVATQVSDYFCGPTAPMLIIEPGSALVADVVSFVARIVAIKQVQRRTVALVSGSIHNIKPTMHGKAMPLQIVGSTADPGSRRHYPEVCLVGYTCMEHDVLCASYSGDLAPGDYAVFHNVGAYTIVMKPPFIRPAPSIVALDSSTEGFEVLRRNECFADVFRTFSFAGSNSSGERR